MTRFRAFAATAAGQPLTRHDFDPGPLAGDQVEIAVRYCGICHSDLSMVDNEWGISAYPVVPGHEVVGTVLAAGPDAKSIKVGQTVGLGWYSGSCMSCRQCMDGDHNLCLTAEQTIVGRPGGFADRVRGREAWVTPLPEGLDAKSAGPLFCGGITVFNPIVQFDVRPTDRVAVIGIGGLGHLALQFLNKWGCEVTAFSSNPAKEAEIRALGAHHVADSRDSAAMAALAGRFNFILNTVNVTLDWMQFVNALAPRGRLHTVGAVAEPISLAAFPLLVGQKSLSGSPLGSPATVGRMLEFCGRHKIAPVTQHYPMSQVNAALDHLRSGKARYRVVLENDFA